MTDYADSELDEEGETYTVRPYAVTGGRVIAESKDLPLEALVSADSNPDLKGLTPEKKKLLQLAAGEFVSVAELAAHLKLPLGVVRVLVTDLSEKSQLTIHTNAGAGSDASSDSGLSLQLLESVLNGIAAL